MAEYVSMLNLHSAVLLCESKSLMTDTRLIQNMNKI